ncbi:MAG: hypothetical protein HQ507_04115 [Candidatus Marinimicrobia bacterium]|nr:hypothetical protein [Candidatus Neomarinimicrobiota bacterium]
MKKLMIIAVLYLAPLFGQGTSSSVSVKVTANVVQFIEMITLADIDVGTVIPSEDMLRLDPRTDQGAGIILVQGYADASIQISYSAQVEMVNLSTQTPLTVNYSVSGNGENLQSASTLFTSNPETVALNDKGEYYLYIGCAFSLLDLVPGTYDGDFVIEVDYN